MTRNHHPDSSRPGRKLACAIVAIAAFVAQLTVMATASADTTGTPDPTVTATFGAQTNVPPPGPLTGLSDGSSVSITATTGAGAAGKLFGIDVRLCKPGLSIVLAAQFSPSSSGNCIETPFAGGAADNDLVTASAAPSNNTATATFVVGAGTQTYTPSSGPNAGVPQTITCGAGNPCSLWVKVAVDTTVHSSGNVFKHLDVQYLGPPGAPQTVTATGGNTQVQVNWAAPASNGGSPITQYTVTLTGPGGPFTQVVAAPATTHTFTGLTNFQTYSATVTATNSAGTGPASAPPATANTGPTPAPTNVMGVSGNGEVSLSWTAAGGPGLTGYRVTASPGAIVQLTGSTATTYVFTGLTNGTAYTFVVEGVYGANFGPASAASAPVTPNSGLNGGPLVQSIDVRRPQGGLVFTQICGARLPGALPTDPPLIRDQSTAGSSAPAFAGGPGGLDGLYPQYPYPVDPLTEDAVANNPTTCGVSLGNAKLIRNGPGAFQFFEAKGFINQVNVVETRDADVGWTVNGTMGTFTSGANSFHGSQMGWQPIMTADSPAFDDADPATPTYDQTVVGAGLVAANTLGGLGSGKPLASAGTGVGLGRAVLDADLTVWIPVTANTGTYTGVLTLTAV